MKTPKMSSEKKTPLTTPRGGKVSKVDKLKGSAKKNAPGSPGLTPFKANLAMKSAQDSFTATSLKSPNKKTKGQQILNGGSTANTPISTNASFSVDKIVKSTPKMNASPKKKGPQKRKSDEGANTPKTTVDGSPKNKKTKNGPKSPEVQLGLKIEKLLKTVENEVAAGKVPSANDASPSSAGGKKKRKKNNKKGAPATVQSSELVKSQESPSQEGAQGKKKRKRNKKKKTGDSEVKPVTEVKADTTQKKKQSKQKKQAVPAKPLGQRDFDAPIKMGDFPNRVNTEGAIKVLLAETKDRLEKKPDLLDRNSVIFVSVDFIKCPKLEKSIQRIVLPHDFVENPDVIFFATDMKSARTDPDQSVDHHKDLFKAKGVDCISEIIPWKRLAREYTQFEEKRKLANRGDIFLIDSKLSHRWPSLIRKKFMKRKAPIPVRLNGPVDLKKKVETAIRKTSFILKSNSRHLAINCGHPNMNIKHLVDNVVTIGTILADEKVFPGGKSNIRSLSLKTAKSQSFPIYVSTASPNTVVLPKQKGKGKQESAIGEVTTAGVTVSVHPSGKIKVLSKDENGDTKRKSQQKKSKADSDDDEEEEEDDDDVDSDEESDMETSKELDLSNSRMSDDDEESSDEEEIEKAEQEFLQELRKQQDDLVADAEAADLKAKKAAKKLPKKAAKEEESSDEEDEDDSELDDIDDEEDDIDDEGSDIDDEEDDDEEDDDSDIPDLVPAKVAKTKPAGFKTKQAAPNKGGKNKPAQVQGKPAAGPKGPNANKPKGKFGGGPGKQANSPKQPQQQQKGKFGGGPGKGKPGNSPQQQRGKFGGGPGKGKPGNSPQQQQRGKFGGGPGKGKPGNSPNAAQKGGKGNKPGSPNSKFNANKPGKWEKKGKGQERYFNMKMGGKKK